MWVPQVNNAAAGQSTVQGSTKANSALAQEPVSSYTVQACDGMHLANDQIQVVERQTIHSTRDTSRAVGSSVSRTEFIAARYDYMLPVLQLKRVSGTLELADIKRIKGWLE